MAFEVYKRNELSDEDFKGESKRDFQKRLQNVLRIHADLVRFGVNDGRTDAQIKAAVDALFDTFASEWFTYVIAGTDALAEAITNDATLGFLNTDVGGQTLRARLVARLS